MGIVDDAKDILSATGEKIERKAHDTKERIGDKADERRAEKEVKKAEAQQESVKQRNEIKEDLRDS